MIAQLIRPIVGATNADTANPPTVTSLTEFTQLVETRLAAAKGPLWHRGCGDFAAHHLSPTLYRHPTIKDAANLLKLEVEMLSRFRQRSIPFVRAPLRDDDWERLFFMQHFGIPTRLLDWTENPFVAMYFALTSHPGDPMADSAVWILDPVAWNQKSLDHISYSGGILSVEETLLDTYKPGAELDDMNTDPVAIYGFHNSARIVAQRGVFTIAGKDTRHMEDIYCANDYPADCLLKVRITSANRGALRRALFDIGFTHSVIYPDLEGLGKEMKDFFGFNA